MILSDFQIPTLLSYIIVVIAVPLHWIVVTLLWRLSRRAPKIRVLRERAWAATALAAVVTVFAAVFLNNNMAEPPLTIEQTQLLTRSAILVLSVPAVYWLWLYRGGRR